MFDNKKNSWEYSYQRGDNFVFYPHEEVIRFVSKFIRKRIGINEFQDKTYLQINPPPSKILDLGCGIGRHVKFCLEMGLDAYGVDLSESAVMMAKSWLASCGISDAESRIIQGDTRHLPFDDAHFAFAMSHGVLDSMSCEISRASCVELARIMLPGGLFYCDLISGDDSSHAREYSGEELVRSKHEENTVQLYFNMQLICELIQDCFIIKECKLVRSEDVLSGGYHSRYHLVLSRI